MRRSFFASLSDFWYALLNLLYPQDCLVCNYKLNVLRPNPICEICWGKIRINPSASFVELKGEGFAFDSSFCVTTYEDVIKRCVHLFKYEGKLQLANPLGRLMADFASKNLNLRGIDLIMPVPLHPLRLRERQFNQSELLATHLAKRLNIKIVRNKIRRTKYTMPQTELKRGERLKNVGGAFSAAGRNDLEGKTILLVDDVLTTGVTVNECAKALKDAGAKKVIAFTLARGI